MMPGIASRLAVFPEVSDTYDPILKLTEDGAESEESYFQRMFLLAKEIPIRYHGKTVALFSHAASVALVAALLRSTTLSGAGTFAPCGIFSLVTHDAGRTWKVESRGDSNEPYVTHNAPTTYAWGFQHSRLATTLEAIWTSVLNRVAAFDES